MRYWPTGPFKLNRDGDDLLEFDTASRTEWWDDVDAQSLNISYACGVYVFAVRSGRVAKPWYVGKAEKQTFRERAISKDKFTGFQSVLKSVQRGTPLLYLYARLTEGREDYSRPTKRGYRDIVFLENMLIGHALQRNPDLLNIKGTSLLSNMRVPGLLNTNRGPLKRDAQELKAVLGY